MLEKVSTQLILDKVHFSFPASQSQFWGKMLSPIFGKRMEQSSNVQIHHIEKKICISILFCLCEIKIYIKMYEKIDLLHTNKYINIL